MAVTRSWEQRTVVQVGPWEKVAPVERRHELPWLIGASAMVAVGLILVLVAKTSNFREASERLQRGELLNLNAISAPEQVAPFLQIFTDLAERELAAQKIMDYAQQRKPLVNVGGCASAGRKSRANRGGGCCAISFVSKL